MSLVVVATAWIVLRIMKSSSLRPTKWTSLVRRHRQAVLTTRPNVISDDGLAKRESEQEKCDNNLHFFPCNLRLMCFSWFLTWIVNPNNNSLVFYFICFSPMMHLSPPSLNMIGYFWPFPSAQNCDGNATELRRKSLFKIIPGIINVSAKQVWCCVSAVCLKRYQELHICDSRR